MRWPRCLATSLLLLAAGCRGLFGLDDPLPGELAVDSAADVPVEAVALCSTTGLTCSGNAVAYQCGETCWVGCDESLSATAAASRCSQWGGKLAPFESASDQQCFRDYIQPNDDAWTGLEQMSGAASVSAGWSWNGDGVVPPFFNWASGQPNDGDGAESDAEQCAAIRDGTNTWDDVPCSATRTFACAEHIDDN
jgi:hypothetical protein